MQDLAPSASARITSWPERMPPSNMTSICEPTASTISGSTSIDDGAPSSIEVLPEIVDAVGSQIEVMFDGGIRSGQDVMRALALGAKSCMIGRAYAYGLGAGGQAGVEKAISLIAR